MDVLLLGLHRTGPRCSRALQVLLVLLLTLETVTSQPANLIKSFSSAERCLESNLGTILNG